MGKKARRARKNANRATTREARVLPEPSRDNKPGTMTIKAISIEGLAARKPLRFAPPYIEEASNPDGFTHWWTQLQFAFPVNDPRTYPAATKVPSEDEARILGRFLKTALDLGRSQVISSEGGYTVTLSDKGGLEIVDSNFPPPDAVAGFAVLLRQCYQHTEPASFKKVSDIVMHLAHATTDLRRDERIEEVKRWTSAEGALRNRSLQNCAVQRLIEIGEVPPDPDLDHYPDRLSPEKIISEYFYGDHLHWDKKATIIDDRARDPFLDAHHRESFLRAGIGLAHIYIGFAALVEVVSTSSVPQTT